MDYKIVYSLWTAPSGDITKHATNWISSKAHLYSWVLSVNKMKEFHKEIELVTDDLGKKILVDTLELPFTSVKVELNNIEEYKDFWALGKIIAYSLQDKPFLHMDADAFFWKGIPKVLNNKEIFAQNIEDDNWFREAYLPAINHLNNQKDFKKPSTWGLTNYAACCGIFGGTDIKTIKKYSKEAFNFIKNNKKVFKNITDKGSYCIIFEQYLLATVCKNLNKDIYYLEKYLDKEKLSKHNYTHIWGEKKSNYTENILGNIVKRDYPKQYEIINNGFN